MAWAPLQRVAIREADSQTAPRCFYDAASWCVPIPPHRALSAFHRRASAVRSNQTRDTVAIRLLTRNDAACRSWVCSFFQPHLFGCYLDRWPWGWSVTAGAGSESSANSRAGTCESGRAPRQAPLRTSLAGSREFYPEGQFRSGRTTCRKDTPRSRFPTAAPKASWWRDLRRRINAGFAY
jgi:hypothetical protein